MEDKYIANMIMNERCRRGLSAETVRKGLCDQSMYSRLESGDCFGNIQLVIAVLQRLGLGGNRAGRYLCKDEYDELEARLMILEHIKSGELWYARTVILKYSDKYCAHNHLNRQFAEYMRARMEELQGASDKALELYKKAAAYTVEDYSGCDSFVCISLCEYFIIANIARLMAKLGNKKEALELYEKLLAYCKATNLEKWITTCIYPKTVCEMLEIQTPDEMGNYDRQKWLEECDGALRVLRDTYRLHFLGTLLKNRQALVRLLGMEQNRNWDEFLVHYEKLRERYGISGDLFEWYPYYIDSAFYPVEKLIDERRRLYNISLEKLAEGVCSPETVSRIINRKVSPKYSTVAAILEKLGLKGVLHEHIIVSEDREAHRLWDELVKCNSIDDYITAERLCDKLREKLDLSIKINEMVLEYKRAEIDRLHGF